MARTEYYDDPQAPVPNSLVPAASALVANEHGEILMQRRADSGNWALPGGTMDLGESLPQTAIREVKEETGLDVEIIGLVGVFTDPKHIITYANGEVRQQFNICFVARIVGGTLFGSDESTALEWIRPEDLDRYPMHESQKLRVRHHLSGARAPWLG